MSNYIDRINKLFDKQKLVKAVSGLCAAKTVNPPGNEYLLNKQIENIFKDVGCQKIDILEKKEGRSNLLGQLEGKKKGPVLAIVGHSDVVTADGQDWKTDPFQPVIKDGNIYARGAIDNKGPFVAALEGVRIFNMITKGEFDGEILLISAADEEAGSTYGIKYLFEEVGIVCDYAIIPDGGEFSHAVYGEMGVLQLKFEAVGKAFHGSMPELGVNAIAPVAQLYLDLYQEDWQDLEGDGEFENAVLNLGMISGGSAPNIVPEKAQFDAMWRYPLNKKGDLKTIDEKIMFVVEEKLKRIQKLFPKTKVDFNLVHKSYPYLGNKKETLFKMAQESSLELGLGKPELKTIRAETVGKYINQACGAAILVNGPMDGSTELMHRANEFADIVSLENFAKYIALLLLNLQKS